MDRATSLLLGAITAWRDAHKSDPLFAPINAKLTSLEDDLQGDKDGDLQAKSGKPSFPTANNFAARMAAARSARDAATAQRPGAVTARKGT